MRVFPESSFEATTFEEAVGWIATKKGSIIRKAERFRAYCGYDTEDFLQEAYSAAFLAVKKCKERPGLKFEAAFWTLYKANLCNLASSRSQRDVLGADASTAPIIYEEYREEYSDDEAPPTAVCAVDADPYSVLLKREAELEEFQSERLNGRMVLQALHFMTEKQRQVWQCLLERRSPTTEQIAGRLSKTRQGVEQLRDYGLARVREALADEVSVGSVFDDLAAMYQEANLELVPAGAPELVPALSKAS